MEYYLKLANNHGIIAAVMSIYNIPHPSDHYLEYHGLMWNILKLTAMLLCLFLYFLLVATLLGIAICFLQKLC